MLPRLFCSLLLIPLLLSPPVSHAQPRKVTLKEALDRALVANRKLSIQKRQVAYKEATDIKPLLNMLPKVDLSLSRSVAGLHADDERSYQTALSLEVKENIDLFGGDIRAYRRNALSAKAERQQLSFATSQLVYDVTAAYLDLALAKKKVALLKQDVSRFRALTKATDAKLSVGRVAKIDQLNVRFAASKAQNSYLENLRRQHAAKRKLDRLVFADAKAAVAYQDSDSGPYLLSGFRDEFLDAPDYGPWLERRGDIAGDKLSWEQSRSQYREIDMKFLPTLDLVGKFSKNLGPAWLDQPLLPKQEEIESSVALVLNWNLFNGGIDFMTRKENYEKIAIGKLQLQEKRDAAADAIDNLREEITILENLVQSKQKEVALAKERFKLSQSKYRLGGLSTDDYLISQKESLAAEVGFVEAKFELYRNKCQLLHQLGFLLDQV